MPSEGTRSSTGSTVSRRRFIATSAAGTVAAALAGCSGDSGGGGGDSGDSGDSGDGGGATTGNTGSTATGEPVTYVSGNNSPRFKEILRGFAEDFEEERGIPVDIEFTEIGVGYRQRVVELIQGGNPPDIINATQFRIGDYAVQDVLRPVDDVVERVEEEEEEIPDKFKFNYQGNARMVPAVGSVTNNWYRQDIYDEMDLPLPDTWEKEEEAARAITEADNDLDGLGFATAATVYGSYHAWTRLFSGGAQVASRDGDTIRVILDQGDNRERVKEVLDHSRTMLQYSPTGTNWDWGEIYGSYVGGDTATAMYSGGRPKTVSISEGREWADTTKRVSTPYNTDQRDEPLGNAAASGYGLVKGSANPEGAREFVQYLTTGDRLIEFTRALGFHNIPLFDSWYETGSEFREGWDYLNDNFDEETIQAEREALLSDNALPFSNETDPPNPYAASAFASFTLGQMFYNIAEGGMSNDEAIDTAADTLRQQTPME